MPPNDKKLNAISASFSVKWANVFYEIRRKALSNGSMLMVHIKAAYQ
jgi:hypothetical protein